MARKFFHSILAAILVSLLSGCYVYDSGHHRHQYFGGSRHGHHDGHGYAHH